MMMVVVVVEEGELVAKQQQSSRAYTAYLSHSGFQSDSFVPRRVPLRLTEDPLMEQTAAASVITEESAASQRWMDHKETLSDHKEAERHKTIQKDTLQKNCSQT